MTIFGAGREDHGIKGFSLIEVFIVIVVAAILMTIANSMFTASGKNTNLREAAGALVEDIKLAKGRAVSESVKYTITFDVDNNTYTINKLDPNDTTDSTIISSTTRTLGEFGNGT